MSAARRKPDPTHLGRETVSLHAITTPSAATLRVDLLGPVVVTCADDDIVLSPMELNLLVALALTPGVPVSTDRLIDDLWGDRLPAAPRTRLQGLVSGLRRKVGDLVRTRYPGYELDRDRLVRDVDEHDRLVAAAAEAASAEERLRLLTEAQGLWRGEPLDGVSTPGVTPERTRLCEQRLGVLVARGEAELAVGHHRELVGLLAPAVAVNPLAEQLAGLYMTALYRSSRQADALAAYELIRTRLAEELGADTCPELQALHARILRGEGLPTPVEPVHDEPVPAQLPAADGLFVGREPELDELAAPGHDVVVVSGPGGLGKTALVVAWAHRSAADYADGQLFIDLGDRSTDDVLATALGALGVPASRLPQGTGQRIGLYRTLTHDRRQLVVADDACSVEQVLALVPSGPHARLVVTTRRRLVMLSAHHDVREVLLRPLDASASLALLRRVVGGTRLAREDPAGLVAWCGGWPLLLRHAAATLALRPGQSMAALAEELAFGAGTDHSSPVEDALTTAYTWLSPDAARLFERLGLVTGEFCLHAAALAAGTTNHRVRKLLDELAGAHLVDEDGAGEFRYDAVVGRFARRLAAAQEWTLAGWGLACPDCPPPDDARSLVDGTLGRPVTATNPGVTASHGT
jgi:DNA-binding SARP family transcriptional activator